MLPSTVVVGVLAGALGAKGGQDGEWGTCVALAFFDLPVLLKAGADVAAPPKTVG
jgi:hypothetical protein